MSAIDFGMYFSEGEFRCRHCGGAPDWGPYESDLTLLGRRFRHLIEILNNTRHDLGEVLGITSWYRCANHPVELKKSGNGGPHRTGLAVDLRVSRGMACRVLPLLLNRTREFGLLDEMGLGFKQTGAGRFIHFDVAGGLGDFVRPMMWGY